jgi:transposase-like protein
MAVSCKGAHFPQEMILPCVRWYVGLSPQYTPY